MKYILLVHYYTSVSELWQLNGNRASL